MKKAMPTLGVVGVSTGYVLKEKGFGEIHEVMDHLYPGIMTMGCAAMMTTAADHLKAQIAELKDLPPCMGVNWRDVAAAALDKFGPTIEVDGPHDVNSETVAKAFDDMGRRVNEGRSK